MPRLSTQAQDLILRLCCGPETRLGRRGAAEIKSQPFFAGVPFAALRQTPAAYVPTVQSPTDTSNFDPVDEALATLSDPDEELRPLTSAAGHEQQNRGTRCYTVDESDEEQTDGAGAMRTAASSAAPGAASKKAPKHKKHKDAAVQPPRIPDAAPPAAPIQDGTCGTLQMPPVLEFTFRRFFDDNPAGPSVYV